MYIVLTYTSISSGWDEVVAGSSVFGYTGIFKISCVILCCMQMHVFLLYCTCISSGWDEVVAGSSVLGYTGIFKPSACLT